MLELKYRLSSPAILDMIECGNMTDQRLNVVFDDIKPWSFLSMKFMVKCISIRVDKLRGMLICSQAFISYL